VTATDPAGNFTTQTLVFTVTEIVVPPLEAVLNLTANPLGRAIEVTWTPVVNPALTGYRLYRALTPTGPFTAIATVAAPTTRFVDSAVLTNTRYYYRVVAYGTNVADSAPSNVDDAIIKPVVERLWGEDRLGTAIDISKETFPAADVVIIATSRNFADALSASGLAGSYRAPLLLTEVRALSPATQAEIRRLGVKTAIIVGGPAAVGTQVENTLRTTMGLTVIRYGGLSRYETSVDIAKAIQAHESTLGRPFTKQVFVARGDNFPDALAVSPLAYSLRAPILLTRPTLLPPVVKTYVTGRGFTAQLVAGGTSAVSDPVAAELARAGGMTSVRKGGADRYVTSGMIAEYGVSRSWGTWAAVGVATGRNFPDALTGGVAMGEMVGVLMVTTPDTLHPDIRKQFVNNGTRIFDVRLFGGTSALSANVETQIRGLLQ